MSIVDRVGELIDFWVCMLCFKGYVYVINFVWIKKVSSLCVILLVI